MIRRYGEAVLSAVGLVIFDCDGVLVDSERLAVKVDMMVLARYGLEMTETDVIERFVGRSDSVMVAAIEAHIGCRLPARWEDEFQHLYRDAFKDELKPVDGVIEALDQISTPTCVASSGSHEKMRYTLRLTDLYDQFDGRIFSAHDVAAGKPAPDVFLHAATRMGVAPERCAVVEDSRWGVEAARAAGMRAFAYAGGLTSARALEGPGTVVFDDMRALPRLLVQT